MGSLPVTPRGNQYILVVTDIFNKWIEAFSLVDTTSATLATVLMDEVICRYGVLTHLHSDQSANLCSAVIHDLSHLLGIHTTRSSAYHPEGNGQVKRCNRTLCYSNSPISDTSILSSMEMSDTASSLPKNKYMIAKVLGYILL